jgi:hypothetical protein
MALSQEDRLAISKKIVAIPLQNAASDTITAQIETEKQKAQKEDDANKKLLDDVNVYVHGYQYELERYDGNGRNQLLEQDLVDAANRKLRNFFFPNDPQTPLPSLPDGVWKNFIPFSGSKALGKLYAETYTPITKEQDLINDINAKIAVVESFSNITRSTGQSCNATGTCSLPSYTTQPTCVGNGGMWTAGPDFIGNDAAMQTAATNLINAIQTWENFINGTFSVVVTTDTEPTRSAQNIASKADITNSISIINTWQALPSFDTTHGQTTCAGFNSYNVALLDPTKFRAAELLPVKNEITARQAFITTRMSELNTNLGSIVQDMSNGDLTTATGFYGQRIRIIDTRLNAMGGSLTKLKGLERGQAAQEQAKKANDNAALVYTSVIRATAFRAPATGSPVVHVLDSTGFSPGNAVYIAAENQEEISTTIVSISGNSITLADAIPQKYRQNEFARLYKVL